MDSERERFIADLRAAADFFEQHPTLLVPPSVDLNIWTSSKEDLAAFARAAGKVEKHATTSGETFWLRKKIGRVNIDFNASRNNVCERVVTGTRVTPAHILPARPETEVPKRSKRLLSGAAIRFWLRTAVHNDPSHPNRADRSFNLRTL